mmetsp:Transcript_12163/g.22611  ORF Transcript_12163/g.22611 Transcript_12163/m.22611 type:complete len:113 (+) Transcript_12163:61-399(+)
MDFAPVVSPEFAARQGDNNNDVNGIVPFVSPVLDSSSPDSSTSRSEDATYSSSSDESYDSEAVPEYPMLLLLQTPNCQSLNRVVRNATIAMTTTTTMVYFHATSMSEQICFQ